METACVAAATLQPITWLLSSNRGLHYFEVVGTSALSQVSSRELKFLPSLPCLEDAESAPPFFLK